MLAFGKTSVLGDPFAQPRRRAASRLSQDVPLRRVARSRLGALERVDLVEEGAEVVLLDLEVVSGLQVEPEPVGRAEVAGQAPARAVSLGAVEVDPQPDVRWRVLLDPAGHPFCMTPITTS